MTKKLKKPGVGFILLSLSLVFIIVAFILFLKTYAIFEYDTNRWAITASILAIWFLVFILVNSLFKGDNPFWIVLIYGIITFLLTFAVVKFISPCFAPIGIYFTVIMGNVEQILAGVPRALAGAACYLVSILLILVASFLPSMRKEHK